MKFLSFDCVMVVLFAGGLLSCAPALPPDRPELGAEAKRVLPGRWVSVMDARGYRGTLDKTFYPNGSAEGIITVARRSARLTLQAPPISFKSRWKIEGGTLIAYGVRSQPSLFAANETLPDRLTAVSKDRIEFVDMKTGMKGYLQRAGR